VAFRVTLPQGERLGLESRKQLLVKAGFEVTESHLTKPGFEAPEVIGGTLCTLYWEEDRKVLEIFGEERVQLSPVSTPFYDLLGNGREGYVLVGKSDTEDALQALALYLTALGLDPQRIVAVPLGISGDQMKAIFFDSHVTRKRLIAWGLTRLAIGTSLPDLTLDRYYQILEEAGINDEPWQSCEFIPPALPLAGKSPPLVHLRPNGFTVRSSYREPGNWHYVDWLLKALERVAKIKPVAKRRFPSLFDFPAGKRGPGPPQKRRPGAT
jgi:hypothetical protein